MAKFEIADRPPADCTILVVDDDVLVRRVLVDSLVELGYQVLAAELGAHAQIVSARHRGTIHLLLTDVAMPGLTGPQLAVELKRSRPAMKVLYMSGHSREYLAHCLAPEALATLLQKPFTVEQLSARLQEALADI